MTPAPCTESQSPPSPLPLALTAGDPAGIGLDITVLAWSARREAALPPFVLLADPEAVTARARLLGLPLALEVFGETPDLARLDPDKLPILAIRQPAPASPGRPDPANASAVIAAIERAVAEVAHGRAGAVVTNPIAKATLYAAGFRHPGHTEFLGELAREHFPGEPAEPVMMLADETLRVVPVTVHIPLQGVPAALTRERIVAVCRITARDLVRRFGLAHPRLAVAGLNPHAGEQGSLGREEIDTITPAIEILRAEGHEVTGPHSADTLFHAEARRRYDAAVCMYHDQALIPIKTLAFDTGVNVTLGLPFVRTSPDHGTAFDIAGTGRARPTSLVAALRMAAHLAAGPAPG